MMTDDLPVDVCVCTGVWPLKCYESTFVSYCMPTM